MNENNRDCIAHFEDEFFENVDGVELSEFDKLELELLDEVSKYNEAVMKRRYTV